MNFYNENDPQKAAWLRELIKANVIAPGVVDERSIAEIKAKELREFTQCHFFAGIGVWSYSLRLARWPDDRPVWTGSCPCPSFSAAGKGKGFDDPRHLWPYWSPLIRECGPATVFGEQVDDAIGHGWLDLVYVDLEKAAYAVGAAILGACSVGAPHIRQRCYFVARREPAGGGCSPGRTRAEVFGQESCGAIERSGLLVNGTNSERDGGRPDQQKREAQGRITDGRDCETGLGPNSDVRLPGDGLLQRSGEQRLLAEDGGTGNNGDAHGGRLAMHGRSQGMPRHAERSSEMLFGSQSLSLGPGWLDPLTARSVAEAGATRGFWGDCDWWHARDEKYRPIEPGIQPLAYGAANRVLKLRGYGDAIVPQVAAEFIRCAA